jgi:hypothetical protein
MSEEKKLTSQEWYTILYPNKEVRIMDPDGWDRSNYQYSWYEELIIESEFHKRVMLSTCMFPFRLKN